MCSYTEIDSPQTMSVEITFKDYKEFTGEEIYIVLCNILYLLINFSMIKLVQSFIQSIPPGRKLVNFTLHVLGIWDVKTGDFRTGGLVYKDSCR